MDCCEVRHPQESQPLIKCVVWDLDDTIWGGTLLEGDKPVLKPEVMPVLEELDRRGILNAVASKNDSDRALKYLSDFGLSDLFVVCQIGWNNKSDSIQDVAKRLGLSLDTFLFIDDQAFERDEVRHALPDVETFDPANIQALLDLSRLKPRFITTESAQRRKMYQADLARDQSQIEFAGTREEFLKTLQMRITIRAATESDLRRVEELTIRTNQLNTTGRPYSYLDLQTLLGMATYRLLIVELTDRYGPSGTIGLALLEITDGAWLIKLLIMSCRVISRGIGSILLNYILRAAREDGSAVRSEFIDSGRNRMMYITYKFAGFFEKETVGDVQILEHDLQNLRPQPEYVQLEACGL